MNDQVEEIKAKADIVSIIGEHVVLKKAGRNFWGLCPFHSEKSPSFSVSGELQIFKCFGCGESGDIFTFLQKYEGMEFVEALKFLAEKVGVVLKAQSFGKQSKKEEVLHINELASQVYHYLLKENKRAAPITSYIVETRKIHMNTIEAFRIGAAPEDPTVLSNFLTKKKKIDPNLLVEAGVSVRTRSGLLDRFRARVIFPIFDTQGRCIALAGRVVPGVGNQNFGKYINSPETPTYHKSRSLYGLYQTKGDIKRLKNAVVVEGELDLLSTWQAGIRNVVAIKGTAFTVEQVQLLSRFTPTLTLALDSDFAGDSAAIRAIQQASASGLEIQVVPLGEAKDPDEFAQSNPEGFTKAVSNSVGVWDFIIDTYCSQVDLKTGVGKSQVSKKLGPVLASIPDKIVQAHYIKITADRLSVSEDAVMQQVNSLVSNTANTTPKAEEQVAQSAGLPEKTRRSMLEDQLLNLLLKTDPKLLLIDPYIRLIENKINKKITQLLEIYLAQSDTQTKDEFVIADFIKTIPAELADKIVTMFLEDNQNGKEDLVKEVGQTLKELEILTTKDELQKEIAKLTSVEDREDQVGTEEIQKKVRSLSKKLAALE